MLDDMLHKLEKQGTPNIMLQTFNYMLSLTLNLPYDKVSSQWTHDFNSIPHVLLWAIKHQNLVGWDNFMKGFISIKWKDVHMQLSRESLQHSSTERDTQLTGAAINLSRGIGEDRNKRLYGENRKDHLVYLRSVILEQVRLVYQYPPKLHKQYARIQKVSLEDRLSRSTIHLIHWLNRIKHQKTISERLFQTQVCSQQSIRHFLVPKSCNTIDCTKFPP